MLSSRLVSFALLFMHMCPRVQYQVYMIVYRRLYYRRLHYCCMVTIKGIVVRKKSTPFNTRVAITKKTTPSYCSVTNNIYDSPLKRWHNIPQRRRWVYSIFVLTPRVWSNYTASGRTRGSKPHSFLLYYGFLYTSNKTTFYEFSLNFPHHI